MLECVRFESGVDALCSVGDVVNRGPDSLGALRRLRELGACGVLGNHDLHLLGVAAGRRAVRPGDTLGPLLAAPDGPELIAWLATWPFLRRVDDVVMVHAGIAPAWVDDLGAAERRLARVDPLVPDEDAEFATYTRYCDARGERIRDDPPPPELLARFRPWDEHLPARFLERHTVVFGHWAQRGLVVKPGLRGLDTGCVWGGRLTAWIAEEDRLVDVPARRAYRAPGRDA